MAGDSSMDDPSSVDHFMDWVATWTGRAKSPVDETVQEDANVSVVEAQPAQPTLEESDHKPETSKAIAPTLLAVSSQKQDDDEIKSIAPVISVAHKATKLSTIPAPKLASADKLDHALEPELVERKEGNGLMSSDHAPSKTKRIAYAQHDQQRLPSVPQMTSPSPVRFEVCKRVQHDVMEYFDTKRREYYEGAPKMLQSKDPNASLKSPKKPAKLNPLAMEYSVLPASTDSQSNTIEEMAKGSDTMDLTPMLNALGARAVKIAETAASQEIEQDTAEEVACTMLVKDPVEQETVAEGTRSPWVKNLVEEQEMIGGVTRLLVVKNLPEGSDYTLVQSVIQGAPIMSMKFSQDKKYAQVKVTDVDDSRRIIESGKNGVEINHKGRKHTVFVEMSSEDPVSEDDGLLEIYLDCGATRAVQAEGVDMDLTMRIFYELASGPAPSREVEGIVDSFSGGVRKVVFRFASIQDAVAFRSSLRRKVDWKGKKIEFVQDPCA